MRQIFLIATFNGVLDFAERTFPQKNEIDRLYQILVKAKLYEDGAVTFQENASISVGEEIDNNSSHLANIFAEKSKKLNEDAERLCDQLGLTFEEEKRFLDVATALHELSQCPEFTLMTSPRL